MKHAAPATPGNYLADVVEKLKLQWPSNRAVQIVCHGHSVPAGYFATPVVNSLQAYPHLLHAALKRRFPFAVINVIVTAIGGENAQAGAARFEDEVLCHRADVVTIDYALNDRGLGVATAEKHWRSMIEAALKREVKVLLLTPTLDTREPLDAGNGGAPPLQQHAHMVSALAHEYSVGLADSHGTFLQYIHNGGFRDDLMSSVNHPNVEGHTLVARELLRWFPV
jgi:lysophospholipase L1-like esterase